ncbi:MAG: hypothetical protein P4M09_11240 [Devosia sp.]|nr:hypothetical protein [Devosia sp.]
MDAAILEGRHHTGNSKAGYETWPPAATDVIQGWDVANDVKSGIPNRQFCAYSGRLAAEASRAGREAALNRSLMLDLNRDLQLIPTLARHFQIAATMNLRPSDQSPSRRPAPVAALWRTP